MSYAYGEQSPDASANFFVQLTNASSLDKLNGESLQTGGSVDVGFSAGGDFIVFRDPNTDRIYYGGSVTVGLGVPTIESHTLYGNTTVSSINIYQVLIDFFDGVEGWLSE